MRKHDSLTDRTLLDAVTREQLGAIDAGREVTREWLIAENPQIAIGLFDGLKSPQTPEGGSASNNGIIAPESGQTAMPKFAAPTGSGQLLGRFLLLERVGTGTYGTVWKAEDTKLGRHVAIKIPHVAQLDAKQRSQFIWEAHVAGRLKHPNIVRVHEVGEEGDVIYIVCDLIDGMTLSDWLRFKRPTVREASEICVKLADALHHAHLAGVIHRDLKPANILIGPNYEPHVADFGLAKLDSCDATVTVDGRILGTPAYMAPEQACGESHAADPRSDVYSLGAIYFQLLTNERPFRGDLHQILDQVLHQDPPIPSSLESTVTPDQDTICLKCLEKSPAKRYASAHELADELRRMLRGEPIVARPIGAPAKAIRWCRRYPARVIAAGVLVFICVAGFVMAWRQSALRADADARALETRRSLYASDLNRALREFDDANLQTVENLLKRYLPAEDQPDLRSFEWYYLWRHLNSDFHTLRGHSERALFAVFSHDGATVASSDYDGTVKLWDVVTGRHRTNIAKHSAPVCALAFSPDDATLASCSHDRTVMLRDVTSGRLKATLRHDNQIEKLAFSPNGDVLATVSKDGSLRIWDIATGACMKILKADKKDALDVAFSPDGTLLATCGEDSTVKVWTTGSYELIETLVGHNDVVYCVDFSSDGRTLASGGCDGTIILWNVADGMRRQTIQDARGSIRSLAFSPDGKALAAAGANPLIRLWDTTTGALRTTVYGHQRQVNSVRFSRDGSQLVTASDDTSVKIWDVADHIGMVRWHGHSNWIRTVGYSSDGRTLASCSDDRSVKLWDAATGKLHVTLTGPTADVSEVAFSPDGLLVAAASDDRSIYLWDIATGQLVTTLTGHSDFVNSIAFSPDGKRLASCSKDMTVRLYEVSSGHDIASFKAHDAPVMSIRFSPSGTLLATGSNDKTAKLWDAATGKLVRTFVGHTDSISGLAFSPDGQTLATASRDTSARLWNVQTGRQHSVLLGHHMAVRRVAFVPDGSLLVTSSTDQTLKLWDTKTGEERGTLKGHTAGAFGVCVSPNGSSIASGDEDGTIYLWQAPTTIGEPGAASGSIGIEPVAIGR